MSDNKFKLPFGKIAETYRNFRKRMPNDIATLAENEIKENFKRQGYEKLPNMVIPYFTYINHCF